MGRGETRPYQLPMMNRTLRRARAVRRIRLICSGGGETQAPEAKGQAWDTEENAPEWDTEEGAPVADTEQ